MEVKLQKKMEHEEEDVMSDLDLEERKELDDVIAEEDEDNVEGE
jgi:hypothetical protein